MKIGVLAYQGSFEEHALQTKRAGGSVDVVPVKTTKDIAKIDGVIIPGGESTTIGMLASKLGLMDELRDQINSGLPVLGTCAGAIILAKEAVDSKVKKQQELLKAMDVSVVRNYYGRQRESFEADVDLSEIGGEKSRVVFIRSPAITKVWGNAKSLSKLNGVTIMAQEGGMLATTFHPELSNTLAVHKYFLSLVKK
ncbi:pyridoxal 5'-phosphate synthase glutaminase subunit PdxT [Sulfuracidifex metallicus]|jgi:5'-phosphate synthase pdxT subunit|uniref:Pyridoxal 5'-phosphate synthase subunit PdxT n=1 Tax=Sulfuracidifex metallicus DSM 6482 = JCM 9184 TaxID=523847 RepID=A0A6A9QIS3_SULME|nr:pyridoxal 5'-phosphate synthase glutaminase subunit PdxT [Sulfuracidifex metallicus]MUN28120.1 pyridoxal 5'-phosphate synthase glutaminase subunit PdxT [Sulfuracidifex metallicus DSM 6482 = JCM 9184]WOE51338.1 pyridoxal 5'-phosphate synthase glutaminase subunit PdxT [Sulfuracidifex metallicus DSM 6482 = JCM 9184]